MAACGGVCEKHSDQDIRDKENGKSNAGIVIKEEERKSTR
jgi:hypothetical protein